MVAGKKGPMIGRGGSRPSTPRGGDAGFPSTSPRSKSKDNLLRGAAGRQGKGDGSPDDDVLSGEVSPNRREHDDGGGGGVEAAQVAQRLEMVGARDEEGGQGGHVAPDVGGNADAGEGGGGEKEVRALSSKGRVGAPRKEEEELVAVKTRGHASGGPEVGAGAGGPGGGREAGESSEDDMPLSKKMGLVVGKGGAATGRGSVEEDKEDKEDVPLSKRQKAEKKGDNEAGRKEGGGGDKKKGRGAREAKTSEKRDKNEKKDKSRGADDDDSDKKKRCPFKLLIPIPPAPAPRASMPPSLHDNRI